MRVSSSIALVSISWVRSSMGGPSGTEEGILPPSPAAGPGSTLALGEPFGDEPRAQVDVHLNQRALADVDEAVRDPGRHHGDLAGAELALLVADEEVGAPCSTMITSS